MFKKDWWQKKADKKELCIGWLYNNSMKTDYANHYSKRALDYWSIELAFFCPIQYTEDKIIPLFEKAIEGGFKKMVVFKQGIILKHFEDVFPEFYEEHADAKFIGHILDKGDSYYSIHPQCFLIDLEWWDSVGRPEWGNHMNDIDPYTEIEPVRSEKNWHDGYTPHWIGPGKSTKEYTGKEGGWNLVKALIDDGQKINSWSLKLRESKGYTYGEVTQDGYRNIHETTTEALTNIFYIGNTETPGEVLPQKGQQDENTEILRFKKIVSPAAGISPMLYAWKRGLQPGDHVWIYDVSTFAIGCMQEIIDTWDGTNWAQFAQDLMYKRTGKYHNKYEFFKGIKEIKYTDELVNEISEQGFLEWYKEVWPKLEVNYFVINLLNPHFYDKFSRICKCHGQGSSYVHLSNIFHYEATAYSYSLEERYKLYRELVQNINKYSIDNNILLYCTCPVPDITGFNWTKYSLSKVPEWELLAPWSIGKIFKWNKTKKK